MNSLIYIGYSLCYSIVGASWGFLRWKQYVDREVKFYESERQRFLTFHKIRGEEIPEFLVYEWRNFVKNTERLRAVPPETKDHRSEIAFVVSCWPLSMLWLAAQSSITFVLDRLLNEYNRVTDNKITKIRKDLN